MIRMQKSGWLWYEILPDDSLRLATIEQLERLDLLEKYPGRVIDVR